MGEKEGDTFRTHRCKLHVNIYTPASRLVRLSCVSNLACQCIVAAFLNLCPPRLAGGGCVYWMSAPSTTEARARATHQVQHNAARATLPMEK